MSEMEKYVRRHGKLLFNMAIPVDERTKEIERTAKALEFDFNAWARDVLAKHLHEVEQAIETRRK